jgi:preprotein translocase subunit SecG
MLTLAIILIIAASILMILIVLAQNSKGGGLSSTFGSAGNIGGVVQTNKFLERTTWTLAIALIVFSVTASLSLNKPQESAESKAQEALKELNQMEKTPNILTPDEVNALNEKK